MREYSQGVEILSEDADFDAGLRAVVDYRGDISVDLKDGAVIEGYVFSVDAEQIHLFPKSGGARQPIKKSAIRSLRITGEDTAAGKSWDDWVRRREAERAKSHKKSQG